MAYHKSVNDLSMSEFNTFHSCCKHFVRCCKNANLQLGYMWQYLKVFNNCRSTYTYTESPLGPSFVGFKLFFLSNSSALLRSLLSTAFINLSSFLLHSDNWKIQVQDIVTPSTSTSNHTLLRQLENTSTANSNSFNQYF